MGLSRILGFVVVLVLAGANAQARTPLPVSPGGSDGVAVVAGRCPTFHWTAAQDAESIDLIVYRVRGDEAQGPPERVLSLTLPGTAQGWTPTLGQCLEPGGPYAWSVRGSGEWSEASLFEVSTALSLAEVEEAMVVLKRLLAEEESPTEPGEMLAWSPGADESPEGTRATKARPASVSESSQKGEGQVEAEVDVEAGAFGTAPMLSSSPSMTVDGQIHLGPSSDLFRDGEVFLWTDADSQSSQGSLALGMRALRESTGINNTAVGHQALRSNSTGDNNSAFGEDALASNTTGSWNSAFGKHALVANTSGFSNSAFGEDALYSNTTGKYNSAFGEATLRANTTGDNNSAFGEDVLKTNTTGDNNSAFGQDALSLNETGYSNGAFGKDALFTNSEGWRNNAFGKDALRSNTTGDRNNAFGVRALYSHTIGVGNSAFGDNALYSLTSGSRNLALGRGAGYFVTTGEHNIHIGNGGDESDNRTMRLGLHQDRTFIAGVRGVTTSVEDAIPVLIDSEGQLGTMASSRRFKRRIRDMGDASSGLLRLRPVTFRFRSPFSDRSEPIQFGLIAEEVAEVFPELAVNDEHGRPETVKYHLLSSLLLNELQKLHRQNRVQWALMGLMFLATVALTVGRWRLG